MNEHITKEVEFFTEEQFNNEIQELKKDYYVLGYLVCKTDGHAFVSVVKREAKEHE